MTPTPPERPGPFDDNFDEDDDDDESFLTEEQEEAIMVLLHARLEDGPATVDDILAAAQADGIVPRLDPDDPDSSNYLIDGEYLTEMIMDLLSWHDHVWFADGRIDRIARILDGKVFTYRITAAELAQCKLPLAADLCAIGAGLRLDHTPSEGGTTIRLDERDGVHGLAVPPHLLDGVAEGELVAIRYRGRDLELEVNPAPGPGTAELAAVLARLQPSLDAGRGDELTPHVMSALLAEQSLFSQPALPLSELLTGAGLVQDGAWFGPGDRIWSRFGFEPELLLRAASSYDLDSCCIEALRVVTTRWRAELLGMVDRAEAPALDTTIEALSHGEVAPALAEMLDTTEYHARFVTFAEGLLAAADESGTDVRPVGPHLLVAYLAEQDGDIERAERLYRDVLSAGGIAPAAVEGLAMIAFDRSDFPAANQLLRRIYEPTYSHVKMTERLAKALLGAGRNDRCPCGSGRKYKVCHSGRILVDPAKRVFVVMSKLANFAGSRPRRHDLAYASLMSGLKPDELLTNQLLFDSYLLDAITVDPFRAQRCSLLPDDEKAVLDVLVELPLRLLEIVALSPMVVQDLLTGERLGCEMSSGPVLLAIGQLGLARLLEGEMVGQFTVVPPHRRDPLLQVLSKGQPPLGELFTWFAQDEI